MKIQNYNIDLDKAVNRINKKNIKKVALQIPEGLKSKSIEIVDYMQKNTKCDFFISADPCYGACDIPENRFKKLGVELIIHIGHTEIPDVSEGLVDTIFINAELDVDISSKIDKAIKILKGKKIGLLTTAQHLHKIDEVKKILKKNNFDVKITKGDNRISFAGQILGCNFSSATKLKEKVDSFLFIGSGTFHPLGVLINTKKPVIAFDPYTNQVKEKELQDMKDNVLRQRYGAIVKSKDAKTFGILICTKTGQRRMDLAYKMKDLIDSNNKKSYFIALDFFSSQSLEGFIDVECYVSTACPRIAFDDYLSYKRPIITPVELEIMLGKKKWDDYILDEIF